MIPSIDDIIGGIPETGIPDISLRDAPEIFDYPRNRDIFAARKAWHEESKAEPRCDFASNRQHLKPKKPFFVNCLWKVSEKGPTLSQIKSADYVDFTAVQTSMFIEAVIGECLSIGDWAIITPPARRHREGNFAKSVASKISKIISLPYFPDVFKARNRQRVNAVYDIVDVPKQRNIILYDDIVTTGSTFNSCRRALMPYQKNIVYFASIDNA